MIRLSLLFVLAFGGVLRAQPSDSLFVTPREDGWTIQHRVRNGETIFNLARRFHVPPLIFAESNGMTFENGLREGSIVAVPLGAYNLQRSQPQNTAESRTLYYRVRPGDDLFRISRSVDVPRKTLQTWNHLADEKVPTGQVLRVGWVLFDGTGLAVKPVPAPAPAVPKAVVPAPDTQVRIPVVKRAPVQATLSGDSVLRGSSPEEQSFLELVAAGVNFAVETGPAAFFPSSSKTTLYAFHNIAPRGSVVRVRNPVNGRTIYAKVLGPLPGTKAYNKALIGLSAGARRGLGATGDARLWCEVAYAGY